MKKTLFALIALMAIATGAKADAYENCFTVEYSGYGLRFKITSATEISVYEIYSNSYTGNVILPQTVTNPDDGKSYNLTGILSYAFSGSKITGITLPNGLKSIEAKAFSGSKITSLALPVSLTDCEGAFANMPELTMITLYKGNPVLTVEDGMLYKTVNGRKILIAYPTGNKETTITVPEGVHGIGKYTFYFDKNLTECNLPTTLTTIGEWAFTASGLKGIHIPNGVKTISNDTFNGCDKLEHCSLGLLTTSIGSYTFVGCSALRDLDLPATLTSIGEAAFRATGLSSATIPEGVTTINNATFYECKRLTDCTLPESLTTIGDEAFEKSGLKRITIPANVSKIGDYAFAHSNLTDVTVEGKELSDAVIDASAFYSIPATAVLHVPAAFVSEYEYEPWLSWFASVEGYEEGIFTYEGLTYLVTDDYNQYVQVGDGKHAACDSKASEIKIPMSLPNPINGRYYTVTAVGDYAFFQCNKLTSVELPFYVESIGINSFSTCSSLQSVKMGYNLKSIGSHAFAKCTSLTEVVIPKNVIHISAGAFSDCSSLATVRLCNAALSLINNQSPGTAVTAFLNVGDGNATLLVPIDGLSYYNKSENFLAQFKAIKGYVDLNNSDHIADSEFRSYLRSQSYGADGIITSSELTNLREIRVEDKSVTSLKGIEYFTGLTKLFCAGNKIEELDLSQNTKLQQIYCANNRIHSITLPTTTSALSVLSIWKNRIGISEMEDIVKQLPTRETSQGNFVVIDSCDTEERNVMTPELAKKAKNKGWRVLATANNGAASSGFDGKPMPAGLVINEENFPDKYFRAYLSDQDYGKDGVISNEELAGITKISVYNKGLKNLRGIEHFTALTDLDCLSNQLTSLDVSKNTALKSLDCSYNQIATLDVSKNTEMWSFSCSKNQLTTLDVSKNTALVMLSCNENRLSTLDVSKNTELWTLNCSNNQLTTLDVSGKTGLARFYCYNNQLTSLNLTNCTSLFNFDCSHNKLTSLVIPESTSSNWISILCVDNQLTSLDVSRCKALDGLYCDKNQLTSLDVSNNKELVQLSCSENQIKGAAMSALVNGLRYASYGDDVFFHVINTESATEQNVCTRSQATIAFEKNWFVCDYEFDIQSHIWNPYYGSGITGDVNGDGVVDVADIATVISVMAKGNNDLSADVNGDGVVDVADIATIISEMAANARKLSIED